MTIECGMSGGDEKSCLYWQSMVVNQRVAIFRIVSTNHEFSMNSMVANQDVGMGKKGGRPIREADVTGLCGEKLNFFGFYYVYRLGNCPC